jgi:hypothetical protein
MQQMPCKGLNKQYLTADKAGRGIHYMTKLFFKKLGFKPVLIILSIMFALGCAKAGREIVGVWDNVKATEIVEFKQDGTGVFTYPNSQNPPLAFSWKHAAKSSYILDVNFMGTKKNLAATITDNNLRIESSIGNELYQKHISR